MAIDRDLLINNKQKRTDYLGIFLIFVCFVLFAWLLFINLFPLCGIKGTSMLPSIESGDYAVIAKRAAYERNDTVVFYCTEEEKVLIKRVIATEGDRLLFLVDKIDQEDSTKNTIKLMIARQGEQEFSLLQEDYILEPMLASFVFTRYIRIGQEILIEQGCYFVMGDNRNISLDSRMFGQVKHSDIYGKMFIHAPSNSFLAGFLRFVYTNTKTAQNND